MGVAAADVDVGVQLLVVIVETSYECPPFFAQLVFASRFEIGGFDWITRWVDPWKIFSVRRTHEHCSLLEPIGREPACAVSSSTSFVETPPDFSNLSRTVQVQTALVTKRGLWTTKRRLPIPNNTLSALYRISRH